MSSTGASGAVPRRYQQRALALVRAVRGASGVTTEHAVPESSRWIDAVLAPGRASPAWGILRSDLDRRQVLLEHFSRPPRPQRLASTLIKAAWGLERWVARDRVALSPPLTLVISVGRPVRALELLGFRPDDEHEGLHRARLGALELLLVDVRRLARGPGTSFLRAFDHRHAVAEENLRQVYQDPDLARAVKIKIGEAVMNEPALWNPEEKQVTAQELLERGCKAGREEGRKVSGVAG